MKRFIAALALVLFTAACTPSTTENVNKPSGMMCEKCGCCQKMAQDKTLKEKLGLNKSEGNQCIMGKDGKKCCCEKMMDSNKMGGM